MILLDLCMAIEQLTEKCKGKGEGIGDLVIDLPLDELGNQVDSWMIEAMSDYRREGQGLYYWQPYFD